MLAVTVRAELSSLTSTIEELTARVGTLAEHARASREEDLATDLFAVERALDGARRKLVRLQTPRR